MLYLDTSVIAAYYCPEPLSEQVQELLMRQIRPALSFLTEVEFFSAVAKKVRIGELSKPDGNRVLNRFSAHLEANLFTLIAIKHHHWSLARGWISLFSTSLKTLDALHLSIASAESLQLLTADKQLFQAAQHLDIEARFMGGS